MGVRGTKPERVYPSCLLEYPYQLFPPALSIYILSEPPQPSYIPISSQVPAARFGSFSVTDMDTQSGHSPVLGRLRI